MKAMCEYLPPDTPLIFEPHRWLRPWPCDRTSVGTVGPHFTPYCDLHIEEAREQEARRLAAKETR